MNEAIFMTDRERTQVTGIIERFYRLRDRKGIVGVEATTYQGRQTGVKIRVDDQEKEFVKSVFESEMEAMEEGIESAVERINLWKMENAWHGETVDDFDIRIKEVAA